MNKPTLLILHGWGCDKSVYSDLVAFLEPRYNVVLPELPGFGATPEPPEPWGVYEYAEYVADLCDREGIIPDVLFCHSLGCRIATVLLSGEIGYNMSPRKVIFTGAAGIRPKQTLRQKLRTRLFKISRVLLRPSPEKLEAMRQKYGSADYRSATPMMRQCLVKIVNLDLTELFMEVKNDTLLIWGGNDDSTPLSDGYLMECLMPGAGLAVIEGAGHYAFLEQPALFKKILNSYLGGN
ncbi:MAG: alpha/beta hydrolase [Oscillospiraceae bacterium]|nr:alpha/beta hydrolase [Oscillospiraceae bacterium]